MAELVEMRARGATQTRSDATEFAVDEEFWAKAQVVEPGNKVLVNVRMDADVVDWFKAQGRGHQTRMNAVLRSYMEAHRRG